MKSTEAQIKRAEKRIALARNLHAVSAHFRKHGVMQDKRKEQLRKACRTWRDSNRE